MFLLQSIISEQQQSTCRLVQFKLKWLKLGRAQQLQDHHIQKKRQAVHLRFYGLQCTRDLCRLPFDSKQTVGPILLLKSASGMNVVSNVDGIKTNGPVSAQIRPTTTVKSFFNTRE